MPPKFRRRLNQNRGGGARTGRGGAAQKQFRRSVQQARSKGIDSRSTQQRYDADRQRQAQGCINLCPELFLIVTRWWHTQKQQHDMFAIQNESEIILQRKPHAILDP